MSCFGCEKKNGGHFTRFKSKTPSKRREHCWPTTTNIVGCYMLHPFAHPVACCWMLIVAQSLKPVKLFSQQLPTFLLFCDRRSVAQQCWIHLHSSFNIVEATHAPYAWIAKRLMGCILPTMHGSSQTFWELLHPFAHHCQHARSLRTGRNNLKTWQEQQEHNSKGDIGYLENICGAEQPETCTIDDELNIDLIDAGKHVLAMFLN